MLDVKLCRIVVFVSHRSASYAICFSAMTVETVRSTAPPVVAKRKASMSLLRATMPSFVTRLPANNSIHDAPTKLLPCSSFR